MIDGLLIDALLLAAVGAFGWGGLQLGTAAAVERLLGTLVAGAFAALLTRSVASVLEHLPAVGDDLASILAVVVLAVGGYASGLRLIRWWIRRGDEAYVDDSEDEFGEFAEPPAAPGRLDGIDPRFGALAGALVGLGWGLVFVAMLVLLPSDSFLTRAAIRSNTGGVLVRQEDGLRWIVARFPRFTQTLPKGERGAVVGERSHIDVREPVGTSRRPADSDLLVRTINDARVHARRTALVYNPRLADVAARQATSLARERALSYRGPAGGSLDARVQAALGESAGAFEEGAGIEVVWAHSPANAVDALLEDGRATKLLLGADWSEIGIGTVDMGWFNGRIHVLVLVAPLEADGSDEGEESESGAVQDAPSADGADGSGAVDSSQLTREQCIDAFGRDLDGDGEPDEQSINPETVDCLDDEQPVPG